MEHSIVLAQKYRPLRFGEVVNQEIIVRILKQILKNRKFSVPFMFSGFFGGGKTTLARIFARAILCDSLTEDLEPCNQCESCISFLNDQNLSFKEIDAASNSGVDDIRKLKEEASSGVLGKKDIKVTLIDECHAISSQGNQALLKQLEDGSPNHVYIFCTTEPEKMKPAVRSRCYEFEIKPATAYQIKDRLKEICTLEKIEAQEKALLKIAEFTKPHIRDAVKTVDFLSNLGEITEKDVEDYFGLGDRGVYLEILEALVISADKSLEILNLLKNNYDASQIYSNLIKNTLGVIKMGLGIPIFSNPSEIEKANRILEKYGPNLNRLLEELLERNTYSDDLTLESDIILLSEKLNSSFDKKFKIINKTDVEVVEAEDVSKENPPKIIDESKEEEESENLEESLEQTSKILKRYKSYPESLAMLMDRGRKSSSTKNSKTVELSKNIKDYKKNLDKNDLREYLRNKGFET